MINPTLELRQKSQELWNENYFLTEIFLRTDSTRKDVIYFGWLIIS